MRVRVKAEERNATQRNAAVTFTVSRRFLAPNAAAAAAAPLSLLSVSAFASASASPRLGRLSLSLASISFSVAFPFATPAAAEKLAIRELFATSSRTQSQPESNNYNNYCSSSSRQAGSRQ